MLETPCPTCGNLLDVNEDACPQCGMLRRRKHQPRHATRGWLIVPLAAVMGSMTGWLCACLWMTTLPESSVADDVVVQTLVSIGGLVGVSVGILLAIQRK